MIKVQDERYIGGTLFAELIEVSGWKGALESMRNPKNSWRLNDTAYEVEELNGNKMVIPVIGANDLRLAQTLIKAGGEHRKFLRTIHVQFNLNMSRDIWSEYDTYKFNVKNSTSTMHKLLNEDDEKDWAETPLDILLHTRGKVTKENFFFAKEDEDIVESNIERLNSIREQFLQCSSGAEKKHLRRRAKKILQEGWLQMRTIDTNYEELRSIFLQRRYHLMDIEWTLICDFIRSLPYAKELILHDIEGGVM